MISCRNKEVISTEGDNIERIIPSVDGIKEGCEGVSGLIGIETESILLLWRRRSQHVVVKRCPHYIPHSRVGYSSFSFLLGTPCRSPISFNWPPNSLFIFYWPCYIWSSFISWWINVEPSPKITFKSDGFCLVQVGSSTLTGVCGDVSQEVSIIIIVVLKTVIHPQKRSSCFSFVDILIQVCINIVVVIFRTEMQLK